MEAAKELHPQVADFLSSEYGPITNAYGTELLVKYAAIIDRHIAPLRTDLEAARRENERLTCALHQCLAATGEEAGDADDFRALVNRERVTVRAIKELRDDRDKLETALTAALTANRALEADKATWQKIATDWNEAAQAARQPDVFYSEYSEKTMNAMQALLTEARKDSARLDASFNLNIEVYPVDGDPSKWLLIDFRKMPPQTTTHSSGRAAIDAALAQSGGQET